MYESGSGFPSYGPIADLSKHPSAGGSHPCSPGLGPPPCNRGQNVHVKVEVNRPPDEWTSSGVYRFPTDDISGRHYGPQANEELAKPGDGKNGGAPFLSFRERYLGHSAFSNVSHLLHGYQPPEGVKAPGVNGTQLARLSEQDQCGRTQDKSVVVPADPVLWNSDHVKEWVEWAVREYNLQDVEPARFHCEGRELCHLSRDDFNRVASNPYNGEVLFAHLAFLRRQSSSETCLTPSTGREKILPQANSPLPTGIPPSKNYPMSPHDTHPLKLTKSESSYKGAWNTTSPTQAQGYPHNAIPGMTKPSLETHPHIRNMQDPYQVFGPTSSRLASSGSGQIQLWQFLLELLSDSSNANCITWEGTNGEFKLTDPDEVARRWGERKSKPNMNYDKLSRALRYYYDKNIMTKVHGKRYAYKFDFQGLAQATQPAPTDPAAYKYQSDLFMPGYHPPKLNFAHHHAGIPSSTGSIFPSPTSYWTNPSANLYSNIAAASSMPHSHVTSHIGSYPHYA